MSLPINDQTLGSFMSRGFRKALWTGLAVVKGMESGALVGGEIPPQKNGEFLPLSKGASLKKRTNSVSNP